MKHLEFLYNIVPALLVLAMAFYFFQAFFKNEEKRRRAQLIDALKKESLPIRLQAYERLALLLERIDLPGLIRRVDYGTASKEDYGQRLIATIEKEFDYNLSQQIYITKDCWKLIESAKTATVALIRKSVSEPEIKKPEELGVLLLSYFTDKDTPCKTTLNYLKDEAKRIL